MIWRLLTAGTVVALALIAPMPSSADDNDITALVLTPNTAQGPVSLRVERGGRQFNPEAFRVLVDEQDTGRAMVGDFDLADHAIHFRPRFPFRQGTAYRIELKPDCLWALTCTGKKSQKTVFRIQDPEMADAGHLLKVAPGPEALPANTLRFYLYFSKPMAQGDVYRHISLLNESGVPVEDPFLNLSRGLWDSRQTRLTLLLDPGRMKTGVGPNLQFGSPLKSNSQYVLRVSREMRDAEGRMLGEDQFWRFRTAAPIHDRVDVGSWALAPPSRGSTQPLTARTFIQLDTVNASQRIVVTDQWNNRLPGQFKMTNDPAGWSFFPVIPWKRGAYKVIVDATIEDVSGNSAQTPFEMRDGRKNALRVSRLALPFIVN